MKKHLFLLLLVTPVLFSSCATSNFFYQGPNNIQSIAMVEPYAYLTDAVGNWSTNYLPSPSRFNHELVSEIVTSMMPVREEVSVGHDFQEPNSKAGAWMRSLSRMSASEARQQVIPNDIREAVRKSGCPYGMVITDIGFVKNADQLTFERVLDVAASVLDYVMNSNIDVYSDTEAYRNGIYALIFDSESGKVVWYGSRPLQSNRNPLDYRTLTKQLNTLFKDFLR